MARHVAGLVGLGLLLASPALVHAQGARAEHESASGPYLAPAIDSGQATTMPEQVLIDLRLGHLAARTVRAFRLKDDVLLPVGALLDLAEVSHHADSTGRLEATFPGQSASLVIDQTRHTIQMGDDGAGPIAATPLVRDGEIYVAARTLGEALGVEFDVDWQELVATLNDPSQFPLAHRLAREAARERFRERARAPLFKPDLALGLARPRWDGLVLDYSLVAPSNDPLHSGAYSFALGTDVFGGSLEGSVSSTGVGITGQTRTELSWTGVWGEGSIVQQLRLGDGSSTGPSPRPLRGISVGNEPYVRLSDFGIANYLGNVPPGWTIEAYRGGQLVALDSADARGQFGIRLPVDYGENAVDFVAYGPFGETQAFSRVYRITGEMLPAHHFEYGASVGACTALFCQGTANVDLHYGLSTRWTVRAGLDQFWRDTLPDLVHPYASISGVLSNAWSIDVTGVGNAEAEGTLRFEPSRSLRLSGQYTRYARGVAAPILAPVGQRSRWLATALVRPLGVSSPFYIDAQASRTRTITGSLTQARLETAVQRGPLRLMPYARVEHDVVGGASTLTQPFVGIRAFLLPLARLGPTFGQVWWRANIEAASLSRLSSISATVTTPIGHGVRAELGTMWTRGMRGPSFRLTFTADRGSVRSYTTLSAQRGTPAGMTESVQGSMLADPSTKQVMFTPGPSMQRAGVAGRVFLDMNGNGRFDPNEQPLGNVRVRVGAQTVRSDADGAFRTWNVVPFEPVLVTVDSMSLTSPLWVPTFGTVSVTPGPNRFQPLDIPIAPGGTIDGRVVVPPDAGVADLGGIRVVLTSARTQRRRTVTTFSDGAYSLMSVAPGRYQLSVDERDLDRLHGVARAVRVDVPADENGARLADVNLLVRPVVAVR
jgi:hypothetical protein